MSNPDPQLGIDDVLPEGADAAQSKATHLEAAQEEGASQPRRFPCSKCGGRLQFAPGTSSVICPFCGQANQIEAQSAEVEERDLHEALVALESAADKVEHQSVKCDACAAEIHKPANVTSMSCPFCGSNIVMTAQAATHIKPWGVLPFLVKKQEAAEKFRAWIQSRWFAPNALKRESRLDDGISGVYVPAWTYDAETTTHYTGQRGDAYYVTVGSGKNRSRQRRIRWTSVSGVVHEPFDDLIVLASKSLPEEKARALEPWDTGDVVPYADEYLAGFKAECYQIGVEEGFAQAKVIMAEQIRLSICRQIGGDEQRISSMNTHYADVTFKHLLLPVWISAYRFRDKVFRFLVNARTGEVQGERPYSWLKITLAVLAGLAALGVIVMLLNLKK